MIWWIALTMTLPSTVCVPIRADRIVAADLARAAREFAAAPPESNIGYAPSPGTRRIFHIDELRRLAVRFEIALSLEREVCFEWPMSSVSQDDAIEAMKEALQLPGASIDIIEMGRRAAPRGKIVFPLLGLSPAADRHTGLALWRGYAQYGNGRRFDLWARVKVSAPTDRVVASTPIPSGRAIESADVRLETIADFPLWNGVARRLDEVVGRIARRSIPAGQAVLRTELSEPLAIKAGDDVEVDVESGRAHLKLVARAENSGRVGDIVSVRNPKSGKNFRARVQAKGRVIVMPGPFGMVN
jgi:flagella basal body P-ring formation protein FlgA